MGLPSDLQSQWYSWLEKLSAKKTLSLGIDQGTFAIRYVLFDAAKDEILQWGSFDLADAPAGEKTNFAAIIKSLARDVPAASIGTINFNIQGNSITFGRLQISANETKNETQMIKLALREQLPFRVDNAAYFCREMAAAALKQKAQEGAGPKKNFNYVAIERNALSVLMEPIVDAFKVLPNISTQGFAHEQMIAKLKLSREDETVGFINMGRGVTAICIFRNHRLVFQRDIPLAGQDITRSILIMHRDTTRANQMLTLPEAEQLKRTLNIPVGTTRHPDNAHGHENEGVAAKPVSTEGQSGLFNAIQGVLAAWVQDIRLTFQHFYDHYQGPTLSRVFLLGGSANLGNLEAYLQHELAIETRILQFPKEPALRVAQNAPVFKERFHEYATAVAFANKTGTEGNLVLGHTRHVDRTGLIVPVFRLAYIFLTAIFVTWYGFLTAQSFYLKDVKAALAEHHEFLERIQLPYFEMIKWEKFLNEADMDAHSASAILKGLSRTTPLNLLLSEIAINRENYSLLVGGVIFGDPKGRAVTVADYSKALKETTLFTNIEVPKMDAVGAGDKEGTFRLTAKILLTKKKTP